MASFIAGIIKSRTLTRFGGVRPVSSSPSPYQICRSMHAQQPSSHKLTTCNVLCSSSSLPSRSVRKAPRVWPADLWMAQADRAIPSCHSDDTTVVLPAANNPCSVACAVSFEGYYFDRTDALILASSRVAGICTGVLIALVLTCTVFPVSGSGEVRQALLAFSHYTCIGSMGFALYQPHHRPQSCSIACLRCTQLQSAASSKHPVRRLQMLLPMFMPALMSLVAGSTTERHAGCQCAGRHAGGDGRHE